MTENKIRISLTGKKFRNVWIKHKPVIFYDNKTENDSHCAVDFIGELPTELGRMVLGYLGALELGICSRVCSRWRDLANDDILWKKLILQDGLHSELLLPLTPVKDGCRGLVDECLYRRYYKRGSRAIRDMERDYLKKSQVEASDVLSLANGTIVAALSSKKPRIDIYNLTPDLKLVERIGAPAVHPWSKRTKKLHGSELYLVLELVHIAFICYTLNQGKTELFGIIHMFPDKESKELKFQIESTYNPKKWYTTGNATVLTVIQGSIIVLNPGGLVHFLSLNPFEEKMKVSFTNNLWAVIGNRFLTCDDSFIYCYDVNGQRLLTMSADSAYTDAQITLNANEKVILQTVCRSSCYHGTGWHRHVLLKSWTWEGKRLKDSILMTPFPDMLVLVPNSTTIINCLPGEMISYSLTESSVTWRTPVQNEYLLSTYQFLVLSPHFLLLRTLRDYTVFDVRNGQKLFTNPERQECGLIKDSYNFRTLVFYNADLRKYILHYFSH